MFKFQYISQSKKNWIAQSKKNWIIYLYIYIFIFIYKTTRKKFYHPGIIC